RMQDVGVISQKDAIAYGITGPFLRSTGIETDVRRNQPYMVYDRLDFDIPVGEHGDNLDRYYVRMEEMVQSMRIIEQAIKDMPKGPVMVDTQGRVIPAAMMVDEAKMGRTGDFKGA